MARQRMTTLIEPTYICGLAVAWVAPLVAFVLTPIAQGDVAPLAVLALVTVGAIGVAAGLPSRYFQICGFERGGDLYRGVGVRWMRGVAPYGTYTQRLVRWLGGGGREGSISIKRGPLIDVAQTRLNERVHVAAIIVASGGALQGLASGHVGVGAYLLVVGYVSAMCLCLQRYNRARLERIGSRLTGLPN
jgi:hypothetical protein